MAQGYFPGPLPVTSSSGRLKRLRLDRRVVPGKSSVIARTTRRSQYVEDLTIDDTVGMHFRGKIVLVEDGLHRADRLARPAVDAFVGVDVQLAGTLVDAVDRALLDARLVLDVDARLGNHIGHDSLRIRWTGRLTGRPLIHGPGVVAGRRPTEPSHTSASVPSRSTTRWRPAGALPSSGTGRPYARSRGTVVTRARPTSALRVNSGPSVPTIRRLPTVASSTGKAPSRRRRVSQRVPRAVSYRATAAGNAEALTALRTSRTGSAPRTAGRGEGRGSSPGCGRCSTSSATVPSV